jgi:hypothetical protein
MLARVRFDSVSLRVAENPLTPPQDLAWLLSNGEAQIRAAALRNPNTPKATYQLLAKACGDPDLKEQKIVDAPLSEQELRSLAAQNSFARYIAARHPSSPSDVLTDLASDEESQVRFLVAKHPSLPEEQVEALSRDRTAAVRASILSRPMLSVEILRRLEKDATNEVQLAYVNSGHIPREELEGALEGLDKLNPLSTIHPSTIERLFTDLDDVSEWFEVAARVPNLKRFLLFHPKAPAALWRSLANEPFATHTAEAILRERELPEAVLWALAESPTKESQLLVTRSKSCPAALLQKVASAQSMTLRRAVAAHVNTPPALLALLSQDKAAPVRRSVARNTNTAQEILLGLTKDPDEQVKRAALLSLNKKNTLL